MVNNTVYEFVGSNLRVEIFFKKKERSKTGALKLKIEVSLHSLYWGFKKIRFTFNTYVLQNRVKFIQKLTPGFKNHMKNLDNFRQALQSPKS